MTQHTLRLFYLKLQAYLFCGTKVSRQAVENIKK